MSKASVHEALNAWEASAFEAIKALSDTSLRETNVVSLFDDLVQKDYQFSGVINNETQRDIAKIDGLVEQCQGLDKEMDGFIKLLVESSEAIHAEAEGDDPLSLSEERIRAIMLSPFIDYAGTVSYDELMDYASKISKFTAAPPGYNSVQGSSMPAHFPWPTEDILRQASFARYAAMAPAPAPAGSAQHPAEPSANGPDEPKLKEEDTDMPLPSDLADNDTNEQKSNPFHALDLMG